MKVRTINHVVLELAPEEALALFRIVDNCTAGRLEAWGFSATDAMAVDDVAGQIGEAIVDHLEGTV